MCGVGCGVVIWRGLLQCTPSVGEAARCDEEYCKLGNRCGKQGKVGDSGLTNE